jgi:hypothetical protein
LWKMLQLIRSIERSMRDGSQVPATGTRRLAVERRASCQGFATEWLKRGSSTERPQAGVPPWFQHNQGPRLGIIGRHERPGGWLRIAS